ncbi:MAG: YceI family protein [Solirubrobacterales bacterium]|nr:YceI family protein [Solirubrobacterales bacterium]
MSTTVQQVAPGTYTSDPVHSSFGFAIKHNGISTFRGHFQEVAATLENGVLTGTAQVESVSTPIAPLKEHLLSPEFFNASDTPTIEFRSSEIRVAQDGAAEVTGELTIRGVTKPVTARGTYGAGQNMRGAEIVGFELEATIDRRDYGLDWQAQLPSGGDVIAWDVTLEVRLELLKA